MLVWKYTYVTIRVPLTWSKSIFIPSLKEFNRSIKYPLRIIIDIGYNELLPPDTSPLMEILSYVSGETKRSLFHQSVNNKS